MKKDCMFQYYRGNKMIEDTGLITEKEARKLFNKHFDDFKKALVLAQERDYDYPELAIWNKCKYYQNYGHKLIHLDSDCFVQNNVLYKKIPVVKFVEEI